MNIGYTSNFRNFSIVGFLMTTMYSNANNTTASKEQILSEFKQYITKTQAILAEKGNFLDDPELLKIIKHDLKDNGLGVIIEKSDEFSIQDLQEVYQYFKDTSIPKLEQLESIINDYIAIHNKLKPKIYKSNITQDIESSTQILRGTATRAKIHIPQETTTLFCAGAIRGIRGNLINNAVRAIHDQKESILQNQQSLDITITHSQDENMHHIHIHNYGYIPEDIQKEDIFAQGVTRGGTGIGLRSAQNRVQSLGGDIRYTSSPDNGTTFTVSLPKIQ